jgi:hypothetical protein
VCHRIAGTNPATRIKVALDDNIRIGSMFQEPLEPLQLIIGVSPE